MLFDLLAQSSGSNVSTNFREKREKLEFYRFKLLSYQSL